MGVAAGEIVEYVLAHGLPLDIPVPPLLLALLGCAICSHADDLHRSQLPKRLRQKKLNPARRLLGKPEVPAGGNA